MARASLRRDQLRAHVLQQGLLLFAGRGFDNVTVEQLAVSAGVSPMTVYRYFGTKAALVLDGQVHAAEQLREFASEGPMSEDPRVCVSAALLRLSAVPLDQELYELRAGIIRASPALQRVAAGARAGVEQALVEGLQDRGLPACPWHLRVTAAAGLAAFGEAVRSWRDQAAPDLHDLTKQALTLVWPDLADVRPGTCEDGEDAARPPLRAGSSTASKTGRPCTGRHAGSRTEVH